MDPKTHVLDHPLIQHKVAILREQADRRQGIPGARQRDRHADVL